MGYHYLTVPKSVLLGYVPTATSVTECPYLCGTPMPFGTQTDSRFLYQIQQVYVIVVPPCEWYPDRTHNLTQISFVYFRFCVIKTMSTAISVSQFLSSNML